MERQKEVYKEWGKQKDRDSNLSGARQFTEGETESGLCGESQGAGRRGTDLSGVSEDNL